MLVMAKAPVAGAVKTRLAGVAGDAGAAALAAASLLDTLEAGAVAYPRGRRVLALAGDLDAACRADEIRSAARDWLVVPQGGLTFGDRLVDGHRQAHRLVGGPVVQIGMDTPQVDSTQLDRAMGLLGDPATDAVLGLSEDGGWWALGLRVRARRVFEGIATSRADTGRRQLERLHRLGLRTAPLPVVRDVDAWADAVAVAGACPDGAFASAVRAVAGARA